MLWMWAYAILTGVLGWHINITNYHRKIYSLIHQMYEALGSVLPVNRYYTNYYFDHWTILHFVEGLLRSTNPLPEDAPKDSKLSELAKAMANLSEQRILANLKDVSFTIKSSADVTLIVGSGRVETVSMSSVGFLECFKESFQLQWIFPLLYLLLNRHLEIIKLAQKVVLDPVEMATHTVSLSSIFSVFDERVKRLEGL